jgi:Ulp1 family protease
MLLPAPEGFFEAVAEFLGVQVGDTFSWERYTSSTCPTQTNDYDCGVFSCLFGERLSRGLSESEFGFDQDEIDYYRIRIVIEILEGGLLNFN